MALFYRENRDATNLHGQHDSPRQETGSLHRDLMWHAAKHRKEIISFWFLFIFSIVLGVGVSYGVLGPTYLAKSFEQSLPAGYGEGIYLLGIVNTLDLDNRLLSIEWIAYSCEETGPYSGCNALTNATNFFMDGNASPSSSLDPATAITVYKANLTGYITDGLCTDETSCWQQQLQMGVPYEQTLETSHQFATRTSAYNWRSNSQAYPDVYNVYTTLLAIDPATNSSRNILGLSLTGTVPNFLISMRSRSVANPGYPNLQWRMVTISVARAPIVIGYAFLIWVINWLMTGVVLWITISAVQGRRRIPGDLFGIPITALFALPTVRSIMPGSPAFGCILDYSGIILNLVVLAICSVALLISVIARDAREMYSPEPKHMRLHEEHPRHSVFSALRRKNTANTGLGLSELRADEGQGQAPREKEKEAA